MPVIIALIGAIAAAAFWMHRIRGAANLAEDTLDIANDVRLAARRFSYRWKNRDIHPIDAIDDSTIAEAALAYAYLELDVRPTEEQTQALNQALHDQYHLSAEEVDEINALARWFISQCGGQVNAAISRLIRRIRKFNMPEESFNRITSLLKAISSRGKGELSEGQREALQELKHFFGIR